MLLSTVNMKLRDDYSDLDDLCASLGEDRAALESKPHRRLHLHA